MHLPDLLAPYRQSPDLQALATALRAPGPQRCTLSGPVGSQYAFVLAALQLETAAPLWVVMADREAALYLQNDLEQLLPTTRVLSFPASAKRPYQVDTLDNANVVERTEVLDLLRRTAGEPVVVVTYPEALAEQVLTRQTLQKSTLVVQRGEAPGIEFVVEVLDDYGFEAVDTVYQPGQYAQRGGIVDLFAFNHETPHRLEFLGDEVESIRPFDPISQLSTGSQDELAILPNVTTRLHREALIPLTEFVASQTLWVLDDLRLTLEELDKVFTRAQQLYAALHTETGGNATQRPPAERFVPGPAFKTALEGFKTLELGRRYYRDYAHELRWEGTPQPSFRKEFSLLFEHLRGLRAQGTGLFLTIDREKQERRLREILATEEGLPQAQYLHPTLSAGFVDRQLNLALYTDHQIFERHHRFRSRQGFSRNQALTLKDLLELRPGDFVTHVHHGIGRFAGLTRITVGQAVQEAVRILYQDDDAIFVPVNTLHKISKYAGKEGSVPRLSKLGSGSWEKTKAKIKSRVKQLAFDLVALYAQRKRQTGTAFGPDTYLQTELEASFLYEDTPDQEKATEAVKADLEAPHPMDRLVCGDVGFGKTEIAIRAAFKAVVEGRQVAVLVPTTLLAMQHARSFAERMEGFGVRIDYLNRLKTKKEQTDVLNRLKAGTLDIVIGTHRLLSRDVAFKNLGLLVIDEEHKFGVAAKEKLRLFKASVDTLTLTATPIPRTLQFSLLGIRDLSIIATPPPNRKPVDTVVTGFDSELVRDAIAYELQRRGQVFYVHNRIKDLDEHAAMIKRLVPDARILVGHGQMDGEQLEEVMLKFIANEADVLVCTTIVESGLDIPNANTILISNAHTYGLSDLHQLRGRVGRSNRKAFCYLIAPPLSTLPTDARKRLEALEQFSELGSGLQIAMRDLDIRGAGDILGAEQSGFISEVGYDLYHRILNEAIQELKEEHFPELADHVPHAGAAVREATVETDQEVRIPDAYIPNVAERLGFYQRIAEADTEAALQTLARELIDRFGPIPAPTFALLDTLRIRALAQTLGFERVVLAEATLKCYFPQKPAEGYLNGPVFGSLLAYANAHPERLKLRQVRELLQLQAKPCPSVKDALFLLNEIQLHQNDQVLIK